jgi:hypothetical protein
MIEVNEYVRTKNGEIHKVIEIKENRYITNFADYFYYRYDNNMGGFKSNIAKHSKQLIDLIEEGDYVNGHLVEEVRISCFDSSIFVHEYEIELHENDIKTILTKEQFEANCYKVGGEE